MSLKAKKWLVFIVSIFFLAALILVGRYESIKFAKMMGVAPHKVHVGKVSQQCIECHKRKGVAPNVIRRWEASVHAEKGIDCIKCHEAKKTDFDAFTCPGSNIVIGKHPTPKDCAKCHKQQVEEFTESKHAFAFWQFKNADRSVFEPIVGTKHGCEECHNIMTFWPDGSVGECDVCHPKHTFDISVARNPYTCGECHLGPDHPQIEEYIESKHGNIFLAKGKNWDLSYHSSDKKPIPIPAPVCTTCHMDGAPGVKPTHNVSARLAWESQAPWSFRTVWYKEKLGSWQVKRMRMKNICYNCHAKDFVDVYFLIADLANLQYNEVRRATIYWTVKMTKEGILKRIQYKGKYYSNPAINGWYAKPLHLMYNNWHHEGRRFRFGAEMMAADYTQWHGIWEMQHNLQEIINYAAEHGDQEAKQIEESTDPLKFFPYKIYDVPGNEWSIGVEKYRSPVAYKLVKNYWEMVKANVEAAYKAGFLSDDEWKLWMERYKNKDYYLGTKFPESKAYIEQKERLKKDGVSLKKAIKLMLPSPTLFKAPH